MMLPVWSARPGADGDDGEATADGGGYAAAKKLGLGFSEQGNGERREREQVARGRPPFPRGGLGLERHGRRPARRHGARTMAPQ